MRNQTKSKTAFDRAKKSIPGGVYSPVRAYGSVGGNPPFISNGSGACIYDIDGNLVKSFADMKKEKRKWKRF